VHGVGPIEGRGPWAGPSGDLPIATGGLRWDPGRAGGAPAAPGRRWAVVPTAPGVDRPDFSGAAVAGTRLRAQAVDPFSGATRGGRGRGPGRFMPRHHRARSASQVLQPCAAGPRRARWAAAARPMATTAAADGFGDRRSAPMAQPGGASGCRSDSRRGAVVAGSGEVLAKASSIPGDEGGHVLGPSARGEVPVPDELLIEPGGTRVHQIVASFVALLVRVSSLAPPQARRPRRRQRHTRASWGTDLV
jgi:hypothetical protein